MKYIIVTLGLVMGHSAVAQQLLTEEAALAAAIKNSPLLAAADMQVKQASHLRRTALNLPNPEVMAESPTGTFYAVGILQSIEFPTVYWKRASVLKQQVALAEKGKQLSTSELTRLVRTIYLDAQYYRSMREQAQVQDSLYQQIRQAAKRLFDAGTIDYLALSFAESQYGEIHNLYLTTQRSEAASLAQLSLYTGITGPMTVAALAKMSGAQTIDTTTLANNASLQVVRQNASVARQELELERNRALPGLMIGYLNQGDKNTDTYYRFRLGVTLPLWFWQYTGSIKAAKANAQVATLQMQAQRQQLMAEWQTAYAGYTSAQQALTYYETVGLRQADDLIDAGRRFFESGQTDLIAYLRNTNDAYGIKRNALEALRAHNLGRITIDYLTGEL